MQLNSLNPCTSCSPLRGNVTHKLLVMWVEKVSLQNKYKGKEFFYDNDYLEVVNAGEFPLSMVCCVAL